MPGSARGLGERLFESPDARAWLYGAAGHGDVPPTGPGSAIAVAYLNLLGHAVGWPSPRGGAQGLTDALVGYLAELGGVRAHAARWSPAWTPRTAASRACAWPAASGSPRTR